MEEDRGVIQSNIARYRSLLKTEQDPVKREAISKLLAEHENRLKQDTSTSK